MTRRNSVPPASPALEARHSFARANAILHQAPVPPSHKFLAEASDVRRLSAELVIALESGASLRLIDEVAVKLGAKCLEIQHRTLQARGRGGR